MANKSGSIDRLNLIILFQEYTVSQGDCENIASMYKKSFYDDHYDNHLHEFA